MEQNSLTLLALGLALSLTVSCGKGIDTIKTTPEPDSITEIQLIPLEKALSTLSEFLQSDDGEMLKTRSGSQREINSITTYYAENKRNYLSSKASTEESNLIPDAYLINFEDGAGFAVLGANTSVADIVAVTENGHIENDLTVIFNESSENSNDDDPDDPDDQVIDTVGYYCAEDDDFYSDTCQDSRFVTECIKSAVDCRFEDDYGGGSGGNSSPILATKKPLLNISWGQGNPYNKYCFRRNLVGKKKSACSGCSATAMAMIAAYNEYPNTLIINGEPIDWAGMKTDTLAHSLTNKGKDDVARLIGSIYNFVRKIARPNYTLITPEQIKKRMQEIGYVNVNKHSASDFTYSMKKATSDMLAKNKPVFISAIPKNWTKGHSWVIDGAKYSSSTSNTYLLHFNFGWERMSNGYFSTTCLNPAKAELYDNPHLDNTSANYAYSWHFRLITYDVPDGTCTGEINYSY